MYFLISLMIMTWLLEHLLCWALCSAQTLQNTVRWCALSSNSKIGSLGSLALIHCSSFTLAMAMEEPAVHLSTSMPWFSPWWIPLIHWIWLFITALGNSSNTETLTVRKKSYPWILKLLWYIFCFSFCHAKAFKKFGFLNSLSEEKKYSLREIRIF